MENKAHVPRFVSIVAVALGCVDLVRGFMHTILLDYAATQIAGLDLTTHTAVDQLRLLGVFGISNLVTGAFLILTGIYARGIALSMLAVLPVAYLVGGLGMRANASAYAPTQANWGGTPMMVAYLAVCVVTFAAGAIVARQRRRAAQGHLQR